MSQFRKAVSGRNLLAAVVLSGTVASTSAFASSYVALDGTSMAIENTLDDDLNPRGVRLRLGMPVSQLFDVELHLGGGRDSETRVADSFTAIYMGAFLKAYLPVGQRSALFGLAGFSAIDFNQSIDGREFSDGRSSFSYGFGLETELTDRMDLSADFVRYISDEGPFSEVSAVNLGIKFYF